MLEQMAKRLNNPVIRFIVSLMQNKVKMQTTVYYPIIPKPKKYKFATFYLHIYLHFSIHIYIACLLFGDYCNL